jgi:O-acetyl-ADP-ribose deacetylase (regulator of RNase III)
MEIQYAIGDATDPTRTGPTIIVHVCNDAGAWSKGFFALISQRWELPEQSYRTWYENRADGTFDLGQVQFVPVEENLWVANVIGLSGVRPRGGVPPINYEAVRDGLRRVAVKAKELQADVHMPRIGCGVAGGKWDEIKKLVHNQLSARDVAVTVYDPPETVVVAAIKG